MEKNNTVTLIGRPINGISINGLEYVCDNDNNPIEFDNVEQAIACLKENGYSEQDIENDGIVFVSKVKAMQKG